MGMAYDRDQNKCQSASSMLKGTAKITIKTPKCHLTLICQFAILSFITLKVWFCNESQVNETTQLSIGLYRGSL